MQGPGQRLGPLLTGAGPWGEDWLGDQGGGGQEGAVAKAEKRSESMAGTEAGGNSR